MKTTLQVQKDLNKNKRFLIVYGEDSSIILYQPISKKKAADLIAAGVDHGS